MASRTFLSKGTRLVLPLVSREETEAMVDTGKWRRPDSYYKKLGPRPITRPFHRTNPTPPPART
jgi:hypothetical protein